MTIYIRDNQKRSIVDLELYVKKEGDKSYIELNSEIILTPYSEFLLANLDQKEEIIEAFSTISELRGWLWETFFMGEKNDPTKFDEVVAVVKVFIKDIAADFNLYYVED
jgi:hypothetical protein